jgi:hypothetical protein
MKLNYIPQDIQSLISSNPHMEYAELNLRISGSSVSDYQSWIAHAVFKNLSTQNKELDRLMENVRKNFPKATYHSVQGHAEIILRDATKQEVIDNLKDN